jgi:hypothetical protein
MQNKIPNSDIIGYEGPVGHEKAIHHSQFRMSGYRFKRLADGIEKNINGTRYVLRAGKWVVKDEQNVSATPKN